MLSTENLLFHPIELLEEANSEIALCEIAEQVLVLVLEDQVQVMEVK